MKHLITLLLLFTSINFSQDFWEKSLDITGGSEWDSYVKSIATNSEGHLYTFNYYDDSDSVAGGKEAFLFSDDNGDTWSEKSIIDTNLVFAEFDLTINNHGNIFAWTWTTLPRRPFQHERGLFCSFNNGETWTMLSDGLSYRVLINSVGVIYSSQNGEWKRSYDNGDSWEEIWNDNVNYYGICIDKADNIYAWTENGIYLSTDDGDTWSLVVSGVGSGIKELCKNSKGDLFIMTYDQLLTLPEGSETTSVLLDSLHPGGMFDHRDLFMDNEDNIYLLLEDEGILFSAENGTNWTELNSGIADLYVRCIVQNVDGYLFVGTNDGIYRSVDPITNVKENVSSEELPAKIQLSQNYPNPFNPITTIKYEIPNESARTGNDQNITGSDMVRTSVDPSHLSLNDLSSGRHMSLQPVHVKLCVYDILGREITTLVNEYQTPGSYELDFNVQGLSSGVYFYQLRAGDPSTSSGQSFIETKKMILIR